MSYSRIFATVVESLAMQIFIFNGCANTLIKEESNYIKNIAKSNKQKVLLTNFLRAVVKMHLMFY